MTSSLTDDELRQTHSRSPGDVSPRKWPSEFGSELRQTTPRTCHFIEQFIFRYNSLILLPCCIASCAVSLFQEDHGILGDLENKGDSEIALPRRIGVCCLVTIPCAQQKVLNTSIPTAAWSYLEVLIQTQIQLGCGLWKQTS